MMKKKCKHCGVVFETKHSFQVFCSKKCNANHYARSEKGKAKLKSNYEIKYKPIEREILSKICPNCEEDFETVHSFKVFCCKQCKDTFYNKSKSGKDSVVRYRKSGKKYFIDREYRQRIEYREQRKPYDYKWNQSDRGKELNVIARRRRRAKEKGAEGSHTREEFIKLAEMLDCMCPCCFETFDLKEFEEDHIIPLVKGGSDYIENIQPLCKSCNCKKHIKIVNYLQTNKPDEGLSV